MSFIGRGGCRHCGCREYVKPPEGEKCYHCNHEMDLHVVKYQPQPTVGTPTSKTGESSVQNTMDAATVDVSLMHTGEAFEQGAPDVCFEETWEVRAPSDLAHGHFVKPHDRGAVITKRVSPMTGKDGDIGSSEGNSHSTAAPRSIDAKPDKEQLSPVPKRTASEISTPKRTPIKASNVFVAPAPYNGPKPSCWRLRMSHLAYGTEPSEALNGSYKIAEDGRTIYVGNAESASIRRALRRHFKGMDKQHIGAYLSTLHEEYKEEFITVFWLDITIKHACNCSYLKCFERMEGRKPMYNMQGHAFIARPKRVGSCSESGPDDHKMDTHEIKKSE
ncbi:uncharacterized protein LOC124127963 isoform X3 [Haliotis rufescens]|uniref:uncharacterized protein LOC124127963 isoform X3 n=1 Tax=Haliotis rufescens TaxID=6454 RepID=UPI001EB02004|nr:uncharacterized protein LOC124127963 isoform X3 [Haliotis rufescens]